MKGKHQGIINVKGVILFELNHRLRSREITDTFCQGVHHKVSVQPTLRDMGLIMLGHETRSRLRRPGLPWCGQERLGYRHQTPRQIQEPDKRRKAIEPIIGHLKADHRVNRCHLKGSLSGSLHAVLCTAGFNIRWLLRMIVKKGLGLFLRLLQAAGLTDLQRKLRGIFTVNPSNSASMNWVVG
jgi:hypothetical protein